MATNAPPPAPQRTLLVLNNMGIPLYSCRGLTQTLTYISQAVDIRRSINGAAMNFGSSQFRKYVTRITCTDMRAPRMDDIWPGHLVTMHCVTELSYLTASGAPHRGVVPGSSYTEGDFTFYRPILNVMLRTMDQSDEEYAQNVQWTKEFEEA